MAIRKNVAMDLPEIESGSNAEIVIPALAKVRMNVRIIGESPLLMNKFTDSAIAAIEHKQSGAPQQPKLPRDPEKEWREKIYWINEAKGIAGVPAAGLKKMLVRAGTYAEEKMTVLKGCIHIPADLVTIVSLEGPRKHSAMARPQKLGPVMPVYRPCWDTWEMVVPVIYNGRILTEAKVLNLFQLAGFSVGVGSYRVSCDGTFGMFRVATSSIVQE